jgi:hypothetical protein
MATTEEMFASHAGWCKNEAIQHEAKAKEALDELCPETGKYWHDKWMETAKRYHDNAEFYEARSLMFAEEKKTQVTMLDLV